METNTNLEAASNTLAEQSKLAKLGLCISESVEQIGIAAYTPVYLALGLMVYGSEVAGWAFQDILTSGVTALFFLTTVILYGFERRRTALMLGAVGAVVLSPYLELVADTTLVKAIALVAFFAIAIAPPLKTVGMLLCGRLERPSTKD